jgi:hypothetical protein
LGKNWVKVLGVIDMRPLEGWKKVINWNHGGSITLIMRTPLALAVMEMISILMIVTVLAVDTNFGVENDLTEIGIGTHAVTRNVGGNIEVNLSEIVVILNGIVPDT